MRKNFITLVMALALAVSICCVCAASDDSDTTTDKDSTISTTEFTRELPASLAKLKAVEESEAVAIGLSEQQLSEAFAFAAYNGYENYLKPNNISEDSINLNDLEPYDWNMFELFFSYACIAEVPDATYDDIISYAKENAPTQNEILQLAGEALFKYCYYIENYSFEHLYLFAPDLEELFPKNLIFSNERLKLGEEVAQEISELESK